MESPSLFRRLSSNSKTCAWIITSSAVVGSSAMTTFGLQAKAMAIMARWRIPPEYWCGKCFLCSGEIPTRSSNSETRAFNTAPFVNGLCLMMASAIWSPTERTGLSAFIAPWKTIEILFQRTASISSSVSAVSSVSPNQTSPFTI